MRSVRGTLIAASCALLVATPRAEGWAGTYEGSLQAGPALAGSATAWADGPDRGPINVRRAPLNAAPDTFYSIPRAATCDRADDLAASPDLVAVLVFRGDPDGSCQNAGLDVFVNSAGTARRLETSAGGFSQCAAAGLDVDAGVVAVARYNCQQDPVMLHDVASGTSADLGLELPTAANPLDVRIAGRYVAVLLDTFGRDQFEVVVWDRDAGAELYRADASALRAGADYVVGSHRLELQPDGRVLYGVTTAGGFTGATRWAWASPSEPRMHPIPGSHGHTRGRHGFAGDSVALARDWGKSGASVVGLDGAISNTFSEQYLQGSIDFDGARLVWADSLIHNEAYPYHPPPPGPPAPPPAPQTAPPSPKPSAPAAAAAPVIAKKARALKAFSGTAADADGDLLLIRVGLARTKGSRCETLRKSGRLARVRRTSGRCVPTTWLAATGLASWKLKLRRRLPPGRYALYVQAVDAAGNAQVTFTKAVGNLRTFTLR